MWSVMNYLNAIDLYKLLHFPRAFDHKDNRISIGTAQSKNGLFIPIKKEVSFKKLAVIKE